MSDILNGLNYISGQIRQLTEKVSYLERVIDEMYRHQVVPFGDSVNGTRIASGQPILVDNRDFGVGFNQTMGGQYEEHIFLAIRRFLKPGITMLDIGANIGVYTTRCMPYLRPGGRIFSFEPNPRIFSLLKNNVLINGFQDEVLLHNCAVSEESGELDLFFDVSYSGGGSLSVSDEQKKVWSSVNVKAYRLDEIIPEDVIVDFVKIDIEGHEPKAIEGMTEIISRSKNIKIVLELFPSMLGGPENAHRFLERLRSLGLNIWKITGDGRLEAVSSEERIQSDSYVLAARNIDENYDFAVWPDAMHLHGDARSSQICSVEKHDGKIMFKGDPNFSGIICHGPYVYMHPGYYRVKFDAEIEGTFDVSFLHDFGFNMGNGRISSDQKEVDLPVSIGTRYFEIMIRSNGSSNSISLNKVEFHRL